MNLPFSFNPIAKSKAPEVPMTLTALEDNVIIKLIPSGEIEPLSGLKYKTDDEWINYSLNTEIPLSNNESVQFFNDQDHFSESYANFFHFEISGQVKGSGNIQSLMNYREDTPSASFSRLFENVSRTCNFSRTSINVYKIKELLSHVKWMHIIDQSSKIACN